MTEHVLPIDTLFTLSPGWFLVGLYFAILLVLTVYGAHRCYLLYLYTRYRPEVLVPRAPNADLPFVTVQLPVYNELYFAWNPLFGFQVKPGKAKLSARGQENTFL